MTAKQIQRLPLQNLSLDDYRIDGVDRVMTPALAIYPEIVDTNIKTTIELFGDNSDRWRPHVKTAKLGFIMRRMVEFGIRNFKCSTSLELLTACENGALDVAVAYPLIGAGARRVREIADQFPLTTFSALVENQRHIEP